VWLVVHSSWLSLDSFPEAIGVRFPRKGGYKVHELDEAKLMTVASAIRGITSRFAQTLPALEEVVPGLRGRATGP
jgi:hypothetical protein